MSDLSLQLQQASGQLPVSSYFDDALYQREIEQLFKRGPRYVGHSLSVPEVGDFHALAHENEGRALVHTPQGLQLISNVCRHRQAVMLKGRGNLNDPARSMGGNVVMQYAGIRPTRIRRLINLEGFGLAATQPSQAPTRYAQWMDEMKALRVGEKALRSYPSAEAVAERLMKTNPRLDTHKAAWLAQHWARANAQGEWEILGHPAHKITNANLFRVEEILAMYERITAPVLNVEASDNSLDTWWKGRFTLAEYHQRIRSVKDLRTVVIDNAGHMMHHDQPAVLAQHIEAFLNQP
jgi:hypothetical protein